MSWVTKTLSSTIGRKLIMALTGLFLILFLTGHVSGNLLLFKGDGGEAFNIYAKFMTTNPAVKLLSYLTYISIIGHVIFSGFPREINQHVRLDMAYLLRLLLRLLPATWESWVRSF